MQKTVKWQKGEPRFEGLYLVAVRYPNGLGALDLMFWRGEWLSLHEDPVPDSYRIVGFSSTSDMIEFFKGNWPEWDEED